MLMESKGVQAAQQALPEPAKRQKAAWHIWAWPAWAVAFAAVLLAAAFYYPALHTQKILDAPYFYLVEDRVNINTAPVQELMLLPGIGESRARAIVAYRQQNGPFGEAEQLQEISGIGPKIVQGLQDQISY